jgi:peroxiredoxin family protein/TusA-related sulfurtransferase
LREAGGLVAIRADDPAFPRDLEAWARSTGARILRFDDRGEFYEAVVCVAGDAANLEPVLDSAPRRRPQTAMYGAEPPTGSSRSPRRATQTFDLRGQPQAPLLVLTKACARTQPGAVIAAFVDDPSFPEQLERWVATANASVLSVEQRGTTIEARIRVEHPLPAGASTAADATAAGTTAAGTRLAPSRDPASRCTLLVLHNDHEALLAALLVANGSAAQGMPTTIFFSFWALNLLRSQHPNLEADADEPKVGFMQRIMKWMMPKGPERQPLGQMNFGGLGKGMLSTIMRKQQIMGLPELLDNAQQLGVRFIACTMSMSVMGITRRDLAPYPNLEFGGVASFVDEARRSAINMVF